MAKLLSKTKFLNGLQCLKYLWLQCNEPGNLSMPGAVTQHTFDEGHRVGKLARQLFAGGVTVPSDSFAGNLSRTRQLLESRRVLYEPGFLVDGIYSRLDIIVPVNRDAWDIVEVKSSTKVKDENIKDMAFQRLCCTRHGLDIRCCLLVHINSSYVKTGEIEIDKLFQIEDITDRIAEVSRGIEDDVDMMSDVMVATECPEVAIGNQCNDPYDCSAIAYCWAHLPEKHIFHLYHGGKKCSDLYQRGVLTIGEIPESYPLTPSQLIQKSCELSETPHVNKNELNSFLHGLKYPLYFLDFETINPVIPLFECTRPYQQIPFQYSVHVIDKAGKMPFHFDFLSDIEGDPRPQLLAELRGALGEFGSIIVYNQAFEKNIIEELGQVFPQYATWAAEINSRVVDLMAPFRNLSYYHPEQKGSLSIKSILPAMTGLTYDSLAIANGEEASLAFLRLLSGELTSEEKQLMRDNLLKYCATDTAGMAAIIDVFRQLA